jgi:undecaprenyl-diphosphatase
MVGAARNVTALGDAPVLVCINLAAAGCFVAKRKFHALAFVLAAVVGGLYVMLFLKGCFSRPRPQVVPYLCAVDGSSFPSGHSMMSAVIYLTLGVALASGIARWPFKLALYVLALLLAGLVGVSRVFLGVHYPTDVMAGWTAGFIWATFCWLLARKLKRRRGDSTHFFNSDT